MRHASSAVLLLAALCFLAGTLNLQLKTELLGHDALTWWHGAVGLIGFGIALLLWESLRLQERKQ
jgi:hypothetical protein